MSTRNRVLALLMGLALVAVGAAADWPAHRHAKTPNSGCNLCLIAQLPVIQAPHTAGSLPAVARAWHRAAPNFERPIESPAASRATRAPPA